MESTNGRQNKCDSIVDIRCGKGKNVVGKGGIAGYQHFLLFVQCFQKPNLWLKHRIVS